jgi:hypothetical protein
MSDKNLLASRTITVMEDIINFLNYRRLFEPEEDVEFHLERIDHRSMQKYYRFFTFSCMNPSVNGICSPVHPVGRPAEHPPLSEGDHSRQETSGAEAREPAAKHDVQVVHPRNKDPSQWRDIVDGPHSVDTSDDEAQEEGQR